MASFRGMARHMTRPYVSKRTQYELRTIVLRYGLTDAAARLRISRETLQTLAHLLFPFPGRPTEETATAVARMVES